jgi:type III pantothenate kinase
MKLLIDIGNTRMKWATVVDDAFAVTGGGVHRNHNETDVPAAVDRILGQIDGKPEQVLAANVAGDAMGNAIDAVVRKRWNLPVDFAETRPESGSVRNAYDDYRQMGVDRWLAILATHDRHRQAACIIDAGTAVTIDQIDATGTHLGGVIVPGLDLMRRSLLSDTGDIGRLAELDNKGLATDKRIMLGKSTAEAIGGGSLSAICGLIESCIEQLNSRDGDSVVVVTGGDAERILPHLRVAADHRPMLVLEGLRIYSSPSR